MEGFRSIVVISHGFQAHYELGFANGLAENGFSVMLLGSNTTLAAKLHPSVVFHNIRGSQDPSRSKWQKAFGLLKYHARLLGICFRQRGSPFVIIGMLNPEWLVGVVEGLFFRWLAGDLALVVHNVLPHNDHSAFKRLAYRCIYCIARVLLTHTPATQRDLAAQFGIPRERMLLVPHGLNDSVKLASVGKLAARAALGVLPSQAIALFFGRVSHYKGADLLLDALEQCPLVHLLMVGKSGDDAHSASVRERMIPLVESGQAHWVDEYVDDATIERYFAAADVTVLPYRHIDQSGVLLLSLTLGVPVLITPVGGFTDVVNEHNGGLIREATAQSVRDALNDFFTAQKQYGSREDVARTVEHLTWKKTLESYVQRLVAIALV